MKSKCCIFLAGALLISCVDLHEVKEVGNAEPISFTAVISEETKTVLLNQTEVYWCYGDMVSLKGGDGPFTTDLAEGEIAKNVIFTGAVTPADTYYAAYPYRDDAWNGTIVEFDSPQVPYLEKGTFGGINMAVAKTSAGDKSLVFRNVMGYVKISVSAGADVLKNIIITTNGGEKISGGFTVDCAEDEPVGVPSEETGRSYVFTAPAGGFSEGDYYIPMIPGTYSEGITVDLVREDGMVASRSTDNVLTMARGHIMNLGSFDNLDWVDSAEGPEHAVWKGKFITVWNTGIFGNMEISDMNGVDWSRYSPGDVLKIYGGPAEEHLTSWSLMLRSAGFQPLEGVPEVIENPDTVSITLTHEILEVLSSEGTLGIWGSDYCFNLVEIVPAAETEDSDYEETVIWQGEMNMENWSGMQDLAWGSFDWSVAKPGDIITVYFTLDNSYDYWYLRLCRGYSWESLPSGRLLGSDADGNIALTYGMTSFSLILTEEDIYELVNNWGFVVTGCNFTLEKITLATPIPFIDKEKVLFEGELVVDDWTNQPYALSDAGTELQEAGAQPGQVVNFYVELLDPVWNLEIWEGHWEMIYLSVSSVGNSAENEYDLAANGGKIKLMLTDEILNNAYEQQWWGGTFVLSGDNLKVTKITLK